MFNLTVVLYQVTVDIKQFAKTETLWKWDSTIYKLTALSGYIFLPLYCLLMVTTTTINNLSDVLDLNLATSLNPHIKMSQSLSSHLHNY